MIFAKRLAPKAFVHNFPLPVTGEAQWQYKGNGHWRTSITLNGLPNNHILVPSFCAMNAAYTHQFTALGTHPHINCPLHPVPNADPPGTTQPSDGALSAHIDCWHTHADLTHLVVQLDVHIPGRQAARIRQNADPQFPLDHLISITGRPLELAGAADGWPLNPSLLSTGQPGAPGRIYSQMLAQEQIKHRICSPTALAMALSRSPAPPSWQDTINACYDPATKAYGAWPLAIKWAGKCGVVAAIETFSDWHLPQHILNQGTPIICSIRFAKGELTGAPMATSGGHLVLLAGIDAERVQVYDPAAPDKDSVLTTYSTQEFANAWFRRRGAAYVFSRLQIP